MPTQAHLIFIPCVLLVGFVFGYIFGVGRARAEQEKREKKARE